MSTSSASHTLKFFPPWLLDHLCSLLLRATSCSRAPIDRAVPKGDPEGLRKRERLVAVDGEGEADPEPQDVPQDDLEESNAGGDPSPDSSGGAPTPRVSDSWTITSDVLMRHHNTPRVQLYIPTAETYPLPIEYFDILRTTKTDIEDCAEHDIKDFLDE